jgi:hypothetical protein
MLPGCTHSWSVERQEYRQTGFPAQQLYMCSSAADSGRQVLEGDAINMCASRDAPTIELLSCHAFHAHKCTHDMLCITHTTVYTTDQNPEEVLPWLYTPTVCLATSSGGRAPNRLSKPGSALHSSRGRASCCMSLAHTVCNALEAVAASAIAHFDPAIARRTLFPCMPLPQLPLTHPPTRNPPCSSCNPLCPPCFVCRMLQKLKAWPQQDISLIVVGAASVDWLGCAAV